MFSFFKKKPKQEEAQAPAQDSTADIAPATPIIDAQTEAPVALPEAVVPPLPALAEEPATAATAAEEPARKLSWTERLKAGLSKTRDKLGKSLAGLFGGGKIDEDLYEELETVLLTADMGVDATVHLLKDVRERVSLSGLKDASELKGALKDSLNQLIQPLEKPLDVSGKKPFVIMMAGVNGAGKTTSIGKLAKYYQQQGKSVLLAAGDTFRAAAREQLLAWGERNNVTVIAQQGGDAAAVCYDAIQAAMARGIDIVLADTAGRLPTQLHLMEEIKKVKRVIQKALPDAPHEIILVLDANIGQNAINQVKVFDDALGLTGLILTKLDGTAKGGVIAGIAKQRPVPLRFIGVGESIDDLRPFNCKDYVDALFD
ncbi:signal recognition particle-docking protein FtsY [uncultured Aquitalea sp.]|uniref:signal recognition particle-docking protein FtsY n=1 Tax=uncultured Aquitalea sp. TaxID=540272 RepID=UPI0025E21820|nr:signal recognition particle-docking protein FtsY [uncultured Aquitalea sp.]